MGLMMRRWGVGPASAAGKEGERGGRDRRPGSEENEENGGARRAQKRTVLSSDADRNSSVLGDMAIPEILSVCPCGGEGGGVDSFHKRKSAVPLCILTLTRTNPPPRPALCMSRTEDRGPQRARASTASARKRGGLLCHLEEAQVGVVVERVIPYVVFGVHVRRLLLARGGEDARRGVREADVRGACAGGWGGQRGPRAVSHCEWCLELWDRHFPRAEALPATITPALARL